MVINAARQSCTAVKEALNKNPMDTTKNTINFLNTLSEEYLRTMGIKDKITVIAWARKVVGKHAISYHLNEHFLMYLNNFLQCIEGWNP